MACSADKRGRYQKVLGATGAHIVYLFSKEFVILITIAFCDSDSRCLVFHASVVAELSIQNRVELVDFHSGGCISIIIALITVSFQAIKNRLANTRYQFTAPSETGYSAGLLMISNCLESRQNWVVWIRYMDCPDRVKL